MDVFGGGWEGYVDKLREGFRAVRPEDTVVLCGDLSWAMGLEEGARDFAFLDALPGRKLLLKGNHDYWWNTAAKMNRFFAEHGWKSLNILHNNCYEYGEYALCGTRGWFYEEKGEQKVFKRELIRLEASLKAAGSGRSCAFSTTRPAIRAIPVRRSLPFWSSTAWSAAITAISTAAAISWRWRGGTARWNIIWFPPTTWASAHKKSANNAKKVWKFSCISDSIERITRKMAPLARKRRSGA